MPHQTRSAEHSTSPQTISAGQVIWAQPSPDPLTFSRQPGTDEHCCYYTMLFFQPSSRLSGLSPTQHQPRLPSLQLDTSHKQHCSPNGPSPKLILDLSFLLHYLYSVQARTKHHSMSGLETAPDPLTFRQCPGTDNTVAPPPLSISAPGYLSNPAQHQHQVGGQVQTTLLLVQPPASNPIDSNRPSISTKPEPLTFIWRPVTHNTAPLLLSLLPLSSPLSSPSPS